MNSVFCILKTINLFLPYPAYTPKSDLLPVFERTKLIFCQKTLKFNPLKQLLPRFQIQSRLFQSIMSDFEILH